MTAPEPPTPDGWPEDWDLQDEPGRLPSAWWLLPAALIGAAFWALAIVGAIAIWRAL